MQNEKTLNVWSYAILRMAAESHRAVMRNPDCPRREYEMVRIGRQVIGRLAHQGIEVPAADPFSLIQR